MTTCRKLLVAWQLPAPCKCRGNYVPSSMLVLLAKVSDFGGQFCRLMWKWDGKSSPGKNKTRYCWGEKEEKWISSYVDEVICLICKQVNSVLKEFNVKRHYETRHKSYDKFVGEERRRPQSHAGSLNWHSVIKTLRTAVLEFSLWCRERCFCYLPSPHWYNGVDKIIETPVTSVQQNSTSLQNDHTVESTPPWTKFYNLHEWRVYCGPVVL